jgi:hypothetical protein
MAELQLASLTGLPIEGIKALVPTVVTYDGSTGKLWLGRDGAVIDMDWKQALLLAGQCYSFTVGTLSTGIVGGGNGTILDIDQPEFLIYIPTGTAIMPLRMAIQGLSADAVADHSVLQALIALGEVAWDGTGTATTEVAYNMNRGSSLASACSCRSAFTADITTAPVHLQDLARAEVKIDLPANGETPIILDLLYEPDPSPLIVGPATITGYWGGTSAVTGYAQVSYIEFTKNRVTA